MPRKGHEMPAEQRAKISAAHKRNTELRQSAPSRTCTRCKRDLPWSRFGKRTGKNSHLYKHQCIHCVREESCANAAAWRARNPEKVRANQKKQDLWVKFGMRIEDYNALLSRQGGCCAICLADKPRSDKYTRFSVDHDHETGEVRGLLCGHCNSGIGFFSDDPQRLVTAATYLLNAPRRYLDFKEDEAA